MTALLLLTLGWGTSFQLIKDVLAETQGAILPLVSYLDTLQWLFIAVTLGGIAVVIYARLDDRKKGRP